jgi:hypothetical protein
VQEGDKCMNSGCHLLSFLNYFLFFLDVHLPLFLGWSLYCLMGTLGNIPPCLNNPFSFSRNFIFCFLLFFHWNLMRFFPTFKGYLEHTWFVNPIYLTWVWLASYLSYYFLAQWLLLRIQFLMTWFRIAHLFFFFCVLGFELRTYTLSHFTSHIFMMGFFSKIGSHELFVQAGFELQSSLCLPPE